MPRPRGQRTMRIKICGITSYEDAHTACDAGADMLGFNFYPGSPRYISPQAAGRVIERLRAAGAPVAMVGVFVDERAEAIRRVAEACSLDLVQLSGDEPPAVVEALKGKAFKALRPASLAEAEADAEWYGGVGVAEPSFLLDSKRAGKYGGTGELGDLDVAAKLAESYRVLLAGGLTPENVADAVARVQPWGVDVASGVESAPGRKDAARVRQFVRAARGG